MTANGWLQFVVFFAVLLLLMRPLGLYIARVLEGEKTFLDPVLRPIERLLYRACGIQADQEMSWQQYSVAMLIFSFVSLLLTYIIERAQGLLPWNPQHLAGVAPATAFNTAASFTTNTNWQVYTPETTMSYFTQMAGSGVSQLSERGHRHRRRRRPGSRHRAQAIGHHRQLLGGYHAHHPVDPAADLPGGCAGADRPGSDPEP